MSISRAFFPLLVLLALVTTSAHAAPNGQKPKMPDIFECGLTHPDACETAECRSRSAGPVHITVLKDGDVKWNGERVNQKALISFLESAAHSNPQSAFYLDTEVDAPYSKVAPVIFMFQKMRIERVMCVVPN